VHSEFKTSHSPTDALFIKLGLKFTLKVKGREAGVYSALQLEEADCTLTP
jgi:hypothetical protein